jgi:serine/threonine protein kinase
MAAAGRDIDLDKLMASGQVLKDDIATTVVRTMWSGRDVAIKRYNYRGFLRALAGVVRGSRAKRAWHYGQFLKRLSISTPEPLSFEETKKFGIVGKSYLITPYIEGISFHHYIRNKEVPPDQKRRVAEQIKGILDALAHNKISHGDSKPSNFLVTTNGTVLTDLDSMTIHWTAAMAKRRSKRDLARFVTRINTNDISADIRRLCATACGYNGPLPYEFAADYFEIPAAPNNGWNILIRRGFNPQDAMAIIEGGICRDENRYIRHNSSKMARLWTTTARYRGSTIGIYIKQYLQRTAMDYLKHFFRDSRGRRAFKASLMLRLNGLDCPEPLVLLLKYTGPCCTNSILVTEGISGSINLNKHISKLKAEGTYRAETEKKAIIKNLSSYVGKMHKSGIFHGDLRAGNILLQHSDQRWRFYLIDNERTRQFTAMPRRLIIKNLVQLNMFQAGITNTDRIRFLKAYNEQLLFPDNVIRLLCEQTMRKTNKRLKIHELHHPS